MFAGIQTEIHSDVVNLLSVTLICVEEHEVPDSEVREILDLTTCVLGNNYSRCGVTDLKSAPRYRSAIGKGFQTKWHSICVSPAV
jgi:hypothetical protein